MVAIKHSVQKFVLTITYWNGVAVRPTVISKQGIDHSSIHLEKDHMESCIYSKYAKLTLIILKCKWTNKTGDFLV
jgi:hypothetical protein